MATNSSASAARSQEFVPIKEVRDGVVMSKSGSMHALLMASSLNFALKSSDEQDAIIAQYQNFLNSLDFSVQFFIQSRKLNISPYLDTLKERARDQVNELLKIQTNEYVDFIKNFVQSANIVSKSFYIIVSFNPPSISTKRGVFSGIGEMFFRPRGKKTEEQNNAFSEYAAQLQQRVDVVMQGLASTGIRTVPLQTEEIVELFFGLFNPDELEKGKVSKLPQQ
ncbi:MAG: hypothetical protein HYU35_00390 [Parcubacteria group bacterium]|nr:hypothetical protein [Parcubacteria group bacterium]